ncbi:MAG TPA: ATPase [Nanoarchaeota archaeon]|nr:ATPase [Nanoarchaeota archaeon]
MHMKKPRVKPKTIKKKVKKAVFDTSAIIHGKLIEFAEEGKLDNAEVIIPEAVLGELMAQASKGKDTGFIGLEELKKLREIAKERNIKIKFAGERPSYEDILLAKSGRIDILIQDIAKKENATLVTCDLPQALIAEVKGIDVIYFEPYEPGKEKFFEKFLTSDTMSLHFKVNAIPFAKRGKPGNVKLVKLSDKPMTEEDLEQIISEIMDAIRYEEDVQLEYSEGGATVIQMRDMRISIARPPFSDGLEVTIVRPIVKLTLDDYKLSEKLKQRLLERAEGILIAGPPGSGKSTFAASLAEFYYKEKGAIVKTIESPRDLQVPEEITQYAPLEGSFAKTADILLLVRPDYTIFDEVRKLQHFQIFADMRLAGIGMIGVVHASDAISAVQRFIGKIELGMIPHVIDTIIFIKDGEIKKIYELSLVVRTPTGMTQEDLARPIVEVRDFETGKLEYEIYTYGEENIVVPVSEEKESAILRLAKERIYEEVKKYDKTAEIELTKEGKAIIRVRNSVIPRIIGKEGKEVKKLEEKLGIKIEIAPKIETLGKEVEFELIESGAHFVFLFKPKLAGKNASIYVDGEYLFTATIGRKGQIKVNKNSEIGKKILIALSSKKELKVFVQ